ncbi:MAG: SpoIIE family protein phosphatase [Ignavibacteria bacterium]|nr:SpoIIE family protein phosphatase [Ignavibacteria bacterium]
MLEAKSLKVKRNLTALVDFSRIINSSIDLEFILNNVLLTCLGKFLATRGLIALKENNKIVLKSSKGLTNDLIGEFPELEVSPDCIDNPKLNSFMQIANLKVAEKINASEDCIGVVCLGEKLNKSDYTEDDVEFLGTILNISATAVQNSMVINELQKVNRQLDSRVQRLSSLFEISKEFGSFAESFRVVKLLVFSILGQFLIQKYAVILLENDEADILDSKFDNEKLLSLIKKYKLQIITDSIKKGVLKEKHSELYELGIELIVPMQLQSKTRGLILLGSRAGSKDFRNSDIEYIYSVGNLAIISLENNRLFLEALEKQKMEEDLLIARDIQRNLLPSTLPEYDKYDIAAMNVSSKQVGGDYYDVIPIDDEKFYIAIADVSGKGVPASLMMANIQAFLQVICRQDLKIDKATAMINDLVTANSSEGRFITFFWGHINTIKNTLTYVNAGHNPPYIIRGDKIIKLTQGGIIFGVMNTPVPYILEEVELIKDDVLILYTDGVSEAMNLEFEEYSEERLEKVAKNLKNKSANEILNGIKEDVQIFTQGNLQSDDITMIVIKVR